MGDTISVSPVVIIVTHKQRYKQILQNQTPNKKPNKL